MPRMSTARARIIALVWQRPGAARFEVEIDAPTGPVRAQAVSFDAFAPHPRVGDTDVLVNTTAVDLGLGTGGVHLIVPSVPGARDAAQGHAMKLRYTPLQVVVDAVEEGTDAAASLPGTPVVALALHSALLPALLGARSVAPAARIAYVMTDAAALPLAFSDAVAAARAVGMLDATVTCGQAFGGDIEAVNLYSGLCAAGARADIVICGMGPGNLGTGSALGFASLEVGQIVNAVASLGGRAIVAPRISFADPRERHRGVSHHTRTALGLAALAPAEIALPPMGSREAALVRAALDPIAARGGHRVVDVEIDPSVLADAPMPLTSMGRSLDDDPVHFLAAAAAGALAARGH